MFSTKKKLVIIAVVLVGVFAGGLVSLFQKPHVEVSQSFVVQNRRHAAQSAYDYEGYYTIAAANEAAGALTAWLGSPGGVQTVFAEARVPTTLKTFRGYERVFTVRRTNTPFFEVRYQTATKADADDAERVAVSLEKSLREQLTSFQNSDSLSLGVTPAVYVERPVALVRNLAYGALLALALTVFSMLFTQAMKTPP